MHFGPFNSDNSAYTLSDDIIHVRLYKTGKLHRQIFSFIDFPIKHRFNWEYLTVLTCQAGALTLQLSYNLLL
jgi:hypothetical protein